MIDFILYKKSGSGIVYSDYIGENAFAQRISFFIMTILHILYKYI